MDIRRIIDEGEIMSKMKLKNRKIKLYEPRYKLFFPKKPELSEIEELSEEIDLNDKFIGMQFKFIHQLTEENTNRKKKIGLLFNERLKQTGLLDAKKVKE